MKALPPIKACWGCYSILHAASHLCNACGAIQLCALRKADAKRKLAEGDRQP